MCRV